MVEKDSLEQASSPYENTSCSAAWDDNYILGRREIDKNGDNNGTEVLNQSVRSGVPLFYDDDLRDPKITDMLLPVANIEVNGHSSARP